MAYKITIKDLAIRTCLDTQMNLRYVRGVTQKGDFTIPSNYTEKFFDDFKTGFTQKWALGSTQWEQPYHPNYLLQWFDDEQIQSDGNGLRLSAIVKQRYFPEIQQSIPNAIGWLNSKESFKYGIFEFKAKLPKGRYLWPALWLSGSKNWPPEIDLLEGYSKNTQDYEGNTNLQSNVHFKKKRTQEKQSIGGRKHRMANKVVDDFIDYHVWWEPDFIKFYYNGYLVRHITDKAVLDQISENQIIILNNGVQEGFNSNNVTPLAVKSVRVLQKN